MDEQEIEKHSEEEQQEPVMDPTEVQQISQDELTRDEGSIPESGTDQPVNSAMVDEPSSGLPDSEAVPTSTDESSKISPESEMQIDDAIPVIPGETEEEPVAAARSAPTGYSGPRSGQYAQGEMPPEASTEPAWYVIHCYSGYENKVRHNLEQRIETMGMKDRIFDVVIPTQEEIEVREGKRRTVERHIFPGYVLVNMSLSEESWYVVRNTPGVTGFVGMGNLPTALRPEEVSQIIKRMEAEAPTVKVTFKVGERVRIIDGPFNDFRGTVSEIDMERTKVRVMVSFFGRETPVELDFLQVEKA